jgi:hypothetical protein
MVKDLVDQLKKRNEEKRTYSLGEGLSTGSLSEIGVETEGLGDGEVGCLLARGRIRVKRTHPSWCTLGYLVAVRQR